MTSGRALRLRRLFPSPSHRLFSVPLDHSVSMGPVDGLESVVPVVEALALAGADAVIVTKGAVRTIEPVLPPTMLLGVHLSASTGLSPSPDRKVLVGTATEAIALGADFASVQVNFGVPDEPEMLRDLGSMVDQCRAVGLPLLCMAYVKRPGTGPTPGEVRHASRAAADLGADIVKTSHPGSAADLARLVASTPVPLLLGGGVKANDDAALLTLVRETVAAGAAGICIGRNLFQRRPLAPLAREVAHLLHGAG